MPVLIAIILVSFVVGRFAKPTTALWTAVGLALFANAVFVWAIADGKGDDQPSVIVLSLVAGAIAIGAARLGGRLRPAA